MNESTVHIRRAEAADSEAMADIQRRSWSAAYAKLLPPGVIAQKNAGRSAQWKRLLQEDAQPGVNYFLAEVSGTPAGMIVFGPYRDEDLPGAGEIRAIYLLPEYWRKGIGTQLIRFAMAELKKAGYSKVSLWVLAGNSNAIGCYEKSGFTQDGRKQDTIGIPVIELRYSCSLP